MNRSLASFAALLVALAACHEPEPEAPSVRYRVDPREPTATVNLVVDLAASARCEEDLDLVLYREVAVQVMAWDGNHAACRERSLRITFIPERMSKPQLLTRVRELTLKAEEKSGI